MESISVSLALCVENPPGIHLIPVVSLHKEPVMQSYDVFFDVKQNMRLEKPSSDR